MSSDTLTGEATRKRKLLNLVTSGSDIDRIEPTLDFVERHVILDTPVPTMVGPP